MRNIFKLRLFFCSAVEEESNVSEQSTQQEVPIVENPHEAQEPIEDEQLGAVFESEGVSTLTLEVSEGYVSTTTNKQKRPILRSIAPKTDEAHAHLDPQDLHLEEASIFGT
jgi:hypothetical protein